MQGVVGTADTFILSCLAQQVYLPDSDSCSSFAVPPYRSIPCSVEAKSTHSCPVLLAVGPLSITHFGGE